LYTGRADDRFPEPLELAGLDQVVSIQMIEVYGSNRNKLLMNMLKAGQPVYRPAFLGIKYPE